MAVAPPISGETRSTSEIKTIADAPAVRVNGVTIEGSYSSQVEMGNRFVEGLNALTSNDELDVINLDGLTSVETLVAASGLLLNIVNSKVANTAYIDRPWHFSGPNCTMSGSLLAEFSGGGDFLTDPVGNGYSGQHRTLIFSGGGTRVTGVSVRDAIDVDTQESSCLDIANNTACLIDSCIVSNGGYNCIAIAGGGIVRLQNTSMRWTRTNKFQEYRSFTCGAGAFDLISVVGCSTVVSDGLRVRAGFNVNPGTSPNTCKLFLVDAYTHRNIDAYDSKVPSGINNLGKCTRTEQLVVRNSVWQHNVPNNEWTTIFVGGEDDSAVGQIETKATFENCDLDAGIWIGERLGHLKIDNCNLCIGSQGFKDGAGASDPTNARSSLQFGIRAGQRLIHSGTISTTSFQNIRTRVLEIDPAGTEGFSRQRWVFQDGCSVDSNFPDNASGKTYLAVDVRDSAHISWLPGQRLTTKSGSGTLHLADNDGERLMISKLNRETMLFDTDLTGDDSHENPPFNTNVTGTDGHVINDAIGGTTLSRWDRALGQFVADT